MNSASGIGFGFIRAGANLFGCSLGGELRALRVLFAAPLLIKMNTFLVFHKIKYYIKEYNHVIQNHTAQRAVHL
jgi:hypothetical protein